MKKSKLLCLALFFGCLLFGACEKENLEADKPQATLQATETRALGEQVYEGFAAPAPEEETAVQKRKNPRPFMLKAEAGQAPVRAEKLN